MAKMSLDWIIKTQQNKASLQHIIRSTASANIQHRSCSKLTNDTPYLAREGELWDVFCEYLEENTSYIHNRTLFDLLVFILFMDCIVLFMVSIVLFTDCRGEHHIGQVSTYITNST